MALNTFDQESKTVEILLSLRGTTLQKTLGVGNAESEVKLVLELKNTILFTHLLSLFYFLAFFQNWACDFLVSNLGV